MQIGFYKNNHKIIHDKKQQYYSKNRDMPRIFQIIFKTSTCKF